MLTYDVMPLITAIGKFLFPRPVYRLDKVFRCVARALRKVSDTRTIVFSPAKDDCPQPGLRVKMTAI